MSNSRIFCWGAVAAVWLLLIADWCGLEMKPAVTADPWMAKFWLAFLIGTFAVAFFGDRKQP